MTNRLARFHVDPQAVWVVPALAGLLITAYLSWGAWVSAHDLRWLTLNHAWWRADLAPNNDVTLLVAIAVWLVAWAVWWWPRGWRSLPAWSRCALTTRRARRPPTRFTRS